MTLTLPLPCWDGGLSSLSCSRPNRGRRSSVPSQSLQCPSLQNVHGLSVLGSPFLKKTRCWTTRTFLPLGSLNTNRMGSFTPLLQRSFLNFSTSCGVAETEWGQAFLLPL